MSGKGLDDDNHQTVHEIATLALGWTKTLVYVVTVHLLILGVEIYLFWPLLPNYPHVWGDNVIEMLMCEYLFGVLGYVSPLAPVPAVLGRLSHVFGIGAIVMLLDHAVSRHMVLWIAIPSFLWLGSVLVFTVVDSMYIITSSEVPITDPFLC